MRTSWTGRSGGWGTRSGTKPPAPWGHSNPTRPERRLAHTIGHQAAVALERSQLYEREVARSRRTEQIQHLIAELAGSADAAGIAAVLTSTARQVLGADAAAVVLVGEGTDQTAEVVAASGFPEQVLDAVARDVGAPSRRRTIAAAP